MVRYNIVAKVDYYENCIWPIEWHQCQMPMTFTDPAGRFCCLILFSNSNSIPREIHVYHVLTLYSIYVNQKAYKNKVDSSIVVSAISEAQFADTIGMMFFAQVLNLLLVMLCVIDVIFRIRSKVSGVTPWPAHLLASFIQIIAMVCAHTSLCSMTHLSVYCLSLAAL